MKSMMKLLHIILALALTAVFFLSGCWHEKVTKDKESSINKQEIKPYEISVYYPGIGSLRDNDFVEEEINKYLKEKIDATVKLNRIDWGSWRDKMKMMIASAQPFDIMFTAAWDGYQTNALKGAFLELDELIDKHAGEMKVAIDSILLEGAVINGKLYAVPVQKELAVQQGLVFNKRLLEKYKFDLSKVRNLKDIEPMLKTIRDGEQGVVPFLSAGVSSPLGTLSDFEAIGDHYEPGAIYIKGDGKTVVNQYESPEMKNILELIREWYVKGYINSDSHKIKNIYQSAKEGKFFCLYQPLKPGKAEELSIEFGMELIQLPLSEPYRFSSCTMGAMMAISRTSQNPGKAMIFLNMLHTDKKLVNMCVFGVEGRHYVKISDNVIDYPDGLNPHTSGYNPGNSWMFGNQFLNYLWKSEDPHKWKKLRKFDNLAGSSPLIGFTFNPDNVETELAACNAIVSKYTHALGSGAADYESVYPNFIAGLKSAGVDRVIAEKQRQLDEFYLRRSMK
jgi:putative aldouronate transport system substrate-binding protein